MLVCWVAKPKLHSSFTPSMVFSVVPGLADWEPAWIIIISVLFHCFYRSVNIFSIDPIVYTFHLMGAPITSGINLQPTYLMVTGMMEIFHLHCIMEPMQDIK